MNLHEILDLAPHGPDTFVGAGPRYPWGGLYGGQIVAQALQAATPPSTRSSWCTRCGRTSSAGATTPSRCATRSTASATGARSAPAGSSPASRSGRSSTSRRATRRPRRRPTSRRCRSRPDVPRPDELEQESWSPAFERAFVPSERLDLASRSGAGRAVAWMRVTDEIGPDDPAMHQGGLAYLSDDLPTDAVVRAHPMGREPMEVVQQVMFSASLDHAIWFHRPLRVDRVAPLRLHLPDLRRRAGAGHRARLRRRRRARGDHRPGGAAARLAGALNASLGRVRRTLLTGRQVYDLQITATEAPMTLTSAQPGDVDGAADVAHR